MKEVALKSENKSVRTIELLPKICKYSHHKSARRTQSFPLRLTHNYSGMDNGTSLKLLSRPIYIELIEIRKFKKKW